MKKRNQVILIGIIYVIIIGLYINFSDKWYGQISLGAAGSLTASFIYWMCIEKNNEVFPIYKYIFFYNNEIRLSIAYLMRIKIDNKYLLMWNEKRHTFTPVGGVYKYYTEAEGRLRELETESSIDFTKVSSVNDLRIVIKVKNIHNFFAWFKSGIGREWDISREVDEELLIEDSVERCKLICNMKYFKYKTVYRHRNHVHRKRELHYFDIFEWKLDETQQRIIKNMIEKQPNKYILASVDEIKNEKMNDGRILGDNCYSLI